MLRPADESIKQAALPAAEVLGGGSRRHFLRPDLALPIDVVPDWCNAGIGMRVVTAINALAMLVATVMASNIVTWASICLRFAITLEPVLIASLFLGCIARPLMLRLDAAWQVAWVIAVPALLTLLVETLLAPLLVDGTGTVLRDSAIAALLAAGTLYWSQLRSQSNLPALAEARLAALQARIRPHFLFNSLNAVLGLIRTDPKRAETMLEDLADLFRVLMRDHHERVSLGEEIALCGKYLEIESLRLGERLGLTLAIDPRVESAQVPLLLLQPLVENAVLHGIEPSLVPGMIELRAELRGQQVEIFLSNPWHGGETRRGHQMGLSNVRQRLELLHDLEARLDTRVRQERFEVHLSLPYVKAEPRGRLA